MCYIEPRFPKSVKHVFNQISFEPFGTAGGPENWLLYSCLHVIEDIQN